MSAKLFGEPALSTGRLALNLLAALVLWVVIFAVTVAAVEVLKAVARAIW